MPDAGPPRARVLDLIPADSLIGRMTAEADRDRAEHPYSQATFIDEDGVITQISVPADRLDEAFERIERRLGLGAPAEAQRAKVMSR